MSSSYLIYHPERQVSKTGKYTVHHDAFGGNEDPYIWNDRFLHTYCHITQLPNEVGQINFWLSPGDKKLNTFDALYCDCVFLVVEKYFWTDSNRMPRHDALVENDQTYEHHYKWGDRKHGHHQLKRRRRYTLKADPKLSFQPQDGNGGLIDVVPFLSKHGLDLRKLRAGLTAASRGSKPLEIGPELGQKLYDYLVREAKVKLTGKMLTNKHPLWNKGITVKQDDCC